MSLASANAAAAQPEPSEGIADEATHYELGSSNIARSPEARRRRNAASKEKERAKKALKAALNESADAVREMADP